MQNQKTSNAFTKKQARTAQIPAREFVLFGVFSDPETLLAKIVGALYRWLT